MHAERYGGADDLRAMQDLVQRIWTPGSRWHVGDLAWGRFMHTGREPEWPTALWRDGDRVVGWAWAQLALPLGTPGEAELDLVVDADSAGLAARALAWFDDVAPATTRSVTVLETELPVVQALEAAGYVTADSGPYFEQHHLVLDAVPEVVVPQGFRLRPAGPDAAAWATVHGAAFSPSRVDAESVRAVRAAWPYRGDLDRVVEAPDGTLAAYCLAWLDDVNAAGVLEPAGTHPQWRGRGLGRAVVGDALRALRVAGATRAVVSPRGDEAYPVPRRLYRGLGFAPVARTLTFTRRQG